MQIVISYNQCTVQIPKSACGTTMFTTEVTNETTYYTKCQLTMTRQLPNKVPNSMKLTIISKNNMHVHVSSVVNNIASFPGSSQFFNVTRRKTGEPGI